MFFVAAGTGAFVDFFAFQIENLEAVTVVDQRTAFAVEGHEGDFLVPAWMTTAVVPADSLRAEVEDCGAGVGRFLVVLEVVAAAVESDALRIIDAKTPARKNSWRE